VNTKIVASTLSVIAMVAIASAVWVYEANVATPEAVSGIVGWFEGKQLTQLFNLESALLASPYILLFGGMLLLVFFRFRTPSQKQAQGEEMTQFQKPAGPDGNDDGGITLVSADPDSVTTLMLDDLEFDSDPEVQSTEDAHLLAEHVPGNTSDANAPRVDPITEAKVYAACGRKAQAIDLLLEAFGSEDVDHDAVANELITLFGQEMKSSDNSEGRKSAIETQRNEFLDRLSKSEVKLSDDTWKRIQPDDYSDSYHAVA